MRKCCGHCFGDNNLTQQIESRSKKIGKCEFCGTLNVKLLEPADLIGYFDDLIELYEESNDPSASSIEFLLRSDWALFENLDSNTSYRVINPFSKA